MIVFKAYAKKKSYKLRVPQHDSFLSACIKTRTASVFLSVESFCEKLKTPWQCHSEAQRRARHMFGSQVIHPLLLHRAAVPTDLTQQQVKNLGPYGNVQSHVKTFCMSLARVMFTCIFPSPLSPFCLPHAFNLWQEGKRGTDLRFLRLILKVTQAVLVPGTSVLSPPIGSAPLYPLPMSALPSYSCARLFLVGGTDPVTPTPQAMEDFLGHGSFGTFFPAPRRPRLGSYKSPFPGTTTDILHLHRPLRWGSCIIRLQTHFCVTLSLPESQPPSLTNACRAPL